MSKPVVGLALLVLAAALALLLSAERATAFQVGAPAPRSRSSSSRRQPQRQAAPVAAYGVSLGPLRSTTEDKAEAANPAAPTPADAAAPASIESEAPAGPCKKFPKCSGSMRGKGCDGMGKIQGGIATVPGLGWWPIKAYRPCPAAIDAGYGYKRKGQTFGEFIEGKRRPDEE